MFINKGKGDEKEAGICPKDVKPVTEKKILSDKEEPPRTWEELESRLT